MTNITIDYHIPKVGGGYIRKQQQSSSMEAL